MWWLSFIICWFVVLTVDSRAATLSFFSVSDLNYVANATTRALSTLKKKKKSKKLFSSCKIIDSENFIKVSQNPNQVAIDTQGLPTVLHNDFGGLNVKGLASKYLLLMTLPPADDEKMKKNRTSGTPTSEKTSDSASSSKVCHTKVNRK